MASPSVEYRSIARNTHFLVIAELVARAIRAVYLIVLARLPGARSLRVTELCSVLAVTVLCPGGFWYGPGAQS